MARSAIAQTGANGRGRRQRFGRKLGAVVAAIVGLVAFALIRMGLPLPLRSRVVAGLARAGVLCDLKRVCWRPLWGVAVEGLRVYDWPDAPCPVAEARRLVVRVNPAGLWRKTGLLREVEVKGGVARLSTSGPLVRDGDPHDLTVRDVTARLRWEPDVVRLERASGTLAGIRWEAEGVAERRPPPAQPVTFTQSVRSWEDQLQQPGWAWVRDFARRMNSLRHERQARARLRFFVPAATNRWPEVAFEAQGGPTVCEETKLAEWAFRGEFHEGKLTVSEARLTEGEYTLRASLQWDATSGRAAGEIRGSFRPAALWPLLPPTWQEAWAGWDFCLEGPWAVDVRIGPVDLRQRVGCAEGSVAVTGMELQGLWFDRVHFDFILAGDLLVVDNLRGEVGWGAERGLVEGDATCHLNSRRYQGTFSCAFDPVAAISVLGPAARELVGEVQFAAGPPLIRVRASGQIGDPAEWRATGEFHGSNFVFRGVPVAALDFGFAVPAPGVLRLDPFRMVRAEGTAEGMIQQDFGRGWVDAEIQGELNPNAIARMIGPAVERALTPLEFHGPVSWQVSGRLDYNSLQHTDFRGRFQAERVALRGLEVERAECTLVGQGPRLDFAQVQGECYGGRYYGTAAVFAVTSPTNVGYELSLALEQVSLKEVAEALAATLGRAKGEGPEPGYEGKLSGFVHVAGLAGEGQGETVRGQGRVRIREGRLFQIPLLGWLSQVLSRIQPGWGYTQQTDLKATFQIGGGRLTTDDLRLEGELVTVLARGRCGFDQRLDFEVEVQFLRRSRLEPLINLVTLPVRKLFLFHLGGTVSHPRWRPVNLPKELFLIFD